MPTLYFKIGADYEAVIRLRDEIKKLENQLKSFGKSTPEAEIRKTEERLASTKQQMMGLVTEAAKAGAAVENDFKKKIYDASQTVNGLSEKIIAQRAVIKDIEFDVRRLGDAYRSALKNNPIGASGKLSEYNAARKALDEEKATLFGLTQQQAEARLSVKKLRDEYSLYKKEAGDTVEINNSLSVSWGKMLGVIGGVTALKQFGSEIVRVRGEFQSMQTAIETMVGKDMAGVLIPQIKELAKVSPLTLSDMVNAEKMMLGFNIQAEDTIRYLQALSDISMGDGVKFKSLTLAFSQMSAAGKLMGQDLNQMINAGFNPLQIIAEKTGKSIATLKDEMSKGAVSAEMVQQAFIDATSAGGKFYQMSENASKTINGQLSMMQDALDAAFNEMGQASEGVIMEGIQLTTSLIQNYEKVGAILLGLVTAYGVYRAALLATLVLEQSRNGTLLTTIRNLKLATAAQAAFNKVVKAHPYILIASMAIGAAVAVYKFATSTSEAEKATERFNAIMDEHNKKEEEHRQAIDAVIATIQDQNKAEGERLAAFEKLKAEYPTIFQNYTTEAEFLKEIAKYKQLIAQEDAKRSTNSLEEQLKIEQARLDHYVAFRAKNTSTSLVDMDGNGWASDNVEVAIKKQQQVVNELKAQISNPVVNTYLESIKTLKDEDIKSALDEIIISMKALGDSGKDAIAIVASLGGEFSKEQLGMIKSALETEQKSRSSKTTYQEDYEKARKDWEEAKKELAKIEIDKDKFTSKQYEDAKKRVETTEKAYKNLGGLTGTALSKQQKEANKQKQSRQKLADELLSLQEKNQQDEIALMKDGTEKKLKQIEVDYEAQRNAIAKQKRDWAKANKETGVADVNVNGLTTDQQAEIDRANKLNEDNQKKSILEVRKAESDALNDYLKEYGTFQQKRFAIAQEYQQKIAEATTKGERKSLQRQKEEALKEFDFNRFKESINFADVFGNLGEQTTGALRALREKLAEYINQAAKDLRPEDLKELQDAFSNIDLEIAGRDPFGELKQGLSDYKAAARDVEQAQQDLNTVMQGGEIVTGLYTDETGRLVKRLLTQEQAEKKLSDAQEKRQKTLEKLTMSANSIGQTGGRLVNSGYEIIDMLDTFGVLVSENVTGALDGLGQIMSGLESIDLTKPFSALTGSVTILTGLGKTIGSILGIGGADYSGYEAIKEQYDRLIGVWDTLIDRKTEYISIDYGAEAQKAADEAARLVEANISRQRLLMESLASSGSSIGSHSLTYRINARMNASDWDALSRLVGQRVEGFGDVIGLDTDVIGKVLEDEHFVSVLASINSEFIGYIQSISDYGDKLDEIAEKEKEAITSIGFDSFYDGYVDMLADLDATNEDFANDFERYLQQSILSSLVANQYKDRIQALYDSWAELGKDGLTSQEADKLREEYQQITDDLLADRDRLMNDFGWKSGTSSEQSATSKETQQITYDQASHIEGRMNAIYEAQLRGIDIYQNIYNVADESRSILASSFLELQQISENTGEIIKPIKQMQQDIMKIKENTSKL